MFPRPPIGTTWLHVATTAAWASVGSEAYGIAVDAAGNVYVVNRITVRPSASGSAGSGIPVVG